MSKKKWRKGSQILSLDELARQEVVFAYEKPIHKSWFLSWQFRMALGYIESRRYIYYAMPEGVTTRFTDAEVIHAERRLNTQPTLEGRIELMHLLNRYDRGSGDVDDLIDDYENDAGY